MATHLIILAAGEGTRMLSDRPKVLHEVGGRALVAHALASGDALMPDSRIVVVGHGKTAIEAALARMDPDITVVEQSRRLGTAHAVAQAAPFLKDASGDAFVLYGDTPFIGPDTLERMRQARMRGHAVVVLGFRATDPGRYGRLVMEDDALVRIVEWKDASDAERAITLCNSGVVCAEVSVLMDLVARVENDNAAGEYYLTDIVAAARDLGLSATAVTCDEAETLGVNSRADLAAAEAIFQDRARRAALDLGVTLTAPETVFFSADTVLGRDTIVEPNVVFGPGVTAETGAHIRAFSHLEGCHIGQGATVGPFARLRPGAEIGNDARVGNFVEIKSAGIGEGAKVNHLSYVGDAVIGAGANLGAGTITCNYDGVRKHRTEIGARAFIGSNTQLVAPVRVGNDAMTATGSVITTDVPDEALGVARARQVNKAGFATRFFASLRAGSSTKRS